MLKIGTNAQLLLDDLVVECRSELRRVVHQPVKHPLNPVIGGKSQWETGVVSRPAAAYDPYARIFHIWYHATSMPSIVSGGACCYARSRDGVRWDKPQLGLVEFAGSRQNNIIMITDDCPTWVTIAGQPNDARKRFFALFGGSHPASVAACWSADGIRWEKEMESQTGDLRKAPEAPTGPNPRYFHTCQCWAGTNAWGSPRRRGVMRAETTDLKHWGGRRTIFQAGPGDPQDLEFYGMTPHDRRVGATYRGLYLGFLQCFHTDLAVEPKKGVVGCGSVDVELAVSRDTISWQRVAAGTPFLPLGPQGAFDARMVFMHSMVEKCDRLCFYYAGYDLGHGDYGDRSDPSGKIGHARIGLAACDRDRLASLVAERGQGSLVTKPLLVAGDHLLVNADASRGSMTVQVLDAGGALAGSQSRAITTDSRRHHVRWPGRSALASQMGRVVRLKFILQGPVHLYGFQFAASVPGGSAL